MKAQLLIVVLLLVFVSVFCEGEEGKPTAGGNSTAEFGKVSVSKKDPSFSLSFNLESL